MDELRNTFERWWEINYHNGNPPRLGWEAWREGDGYKVDDDESELDGMWQSWQASRAAIEIELPEAELVYSTATDTYGENGCLMLPLETIAKVLGDAGIKVKE